MNREEGRRPLRLGELIAMNGFIRAKNDLARALAMSGAGQFRPHDHRGPPAVIRRVFMPRVGFAGLKAYTGLAKVRLDQEADKRADRVDQIEQRGMGTLSQYDKYLDAHDQQIDDMDAMVREGSNGAPLSGS